MKIGRDYFNLFEKKRRKGFTLHWYSFLRPCSVNHEQIDKIILLRKYVLASLKAIILVRYIQNKKGCMQTAIKIAFLIFGEKK